MLPAPTPARRGDRQATRRAGGEHQALFHRYPRRHLMPSIILWLLGVPLVAIILLNIFGIL